MRTDSQISQMSITITIDSNTLNRIDRYRRNSCFPTRAAVIADLIQRGLHDVEHPSISANTEIGYQKYSETADKLSREMQDCPSVAQKIYQSIDLPPK